MINAIINPPAGSVKGCSWTRLQPAIVVPISVGRFPEN